MIGRVLSQYLSNKSLRVALWYIVGNVLLRGLDFLAAPLFLYLLNPVEYGNTALFLTWMTIFSSVITLQSHSAVARAKFEFSQSEILQFVASITNLCLILGGVCIAGMFILPESIFTSLFHLDRGVVILAVITALGVVNIEVQGQLWIFNYKHRLYTTTNAIVALSRLALSIFLIIVPVFPSFSPGTNRIVGVAAVTIILGTFFALRNLIQGQWCLKYSHWRYALIYSVPIVPHMLFGLLLSQSDRLLISFYIGAAETGIYSFAYQIGSITYMLWSATNNAWTPWFYDQMTKNQRPAIRLRGRQYLVVFTAFTILLVILIYPIFNLLTPSRYREGLMLIPLIMAANFLYVPFSFYVNVEYYEKRTLFVSLGTIVAAIANIGINVIFLPIWGYSVAAWSTLIGYALLFLFHAAVVHFLLQIREVFDFRLMMICGALVIVIGVIMCLSLW